MIQSKTKLIDDLWVQMVARRQALQTQLIERIEVLRYRADAEELAEIMMEIQDELDRDSNDV